ncbi:hypothetical protein BGZ82_001930 [Podila clonocystis]|nr:hypothetical protein BGZ82_001930 [Podila clonocystis]
MNHDQVVNSVFHHFTQWYDRPSSNSQDHRSQDNASDSSLLLLRDISFPSDQFRLDDTKMKARANKTCHKARLPSAIKSVPRVHRAHPYKILPDFDKEAILDRIKRVDNMDFARHIILAQIQPFNVYDQETQALVNHHMVNPQKHLHMLSVTSPSTQSWAMSTQQLAESARQQLELALSKFNPAFILKAPLPPNTTAFDRLIGQAFLDPPSSLPKTDVPTTTVIPQAQISEAEMSARHPPPGSPVRLSASALETLTIVATHDLN